MVRDVPACKELMKQAHLNSSWSCLCWLDPHQELNPLGSVTHADEKTQEDGYLRRQGEVSEEGSLLTCDLRVPDSSTLRRYVSGTETTCFGLLLIEKTYFTVVYTE